MRRSRDPDRKRKKRAEQRRARESHARRQGQDTAAPEPALRARVLAFARSPGATFVLRFVALAALLLLLYAYPYPRAGFVHACFERYLSGYAHAAALLLKQLDPTVTVAGNQIGGRFPLAIVRDCDAMEVNILFVSGIAAFPARLSHRVAGVGLGLLLLVGANLSRIVSLYFIGVASPDSFEFAHREAWPLVLIATALALFLAWTRWELRSQADEPSASPA